MVHRLIRLLILLAAVILCPCPALAQVDPIARGEILHLKELAAAADKRYEQRFDAQEKAVASALNAQEKASAAALAAAKEAVLKAETATNDRLSIHNGLQARLDAQAATLPTRKEVDQQVISLTERLNRLQERMDKNDGKDTGAASLFGYILGALGLLIGLGGLIWRMQSGNRAANVRADDLAKQGTRTT